MAGADRFLKTYAIQHLRGCQCACGDWTWVTGCGSHGGVLHCKIYYESADDRTLSGSEIGCSTCVSHGENETYVDRNKTFTLVLQPFTSNSFTAASKDKLAPSDPVGQGRVSCHFETKSVFTHPDLDLDRDRELERECRVPSFERADERAGEWLADFPEPRGLTLLDAEWDSWTNHTPTHVLSAPTAWQTMNTKNNISLNIFYVNN